MVLCEAFFCSGNVSVLPVCGLPGTIAVTLGVSRLAGSTLGHSGHVKDSGENEL